MRVAHGFARVLGRRGFEIRRHPAARRQALLGRDGVDLVLDVGASTGGFGSELRSFGYTGTIVSFEPLGQAYADLSALVADDPGWTARHTAIGAEAGEASINVASNSTSSSLLPMLDAHTEAAPHVRYVGEEVVAVQRLDDAAADVLERAAQPFLKIDTQGFEREVLAGAPLTVERCAGLQLELSFVPLYGGGMLVDEALTWAYDHGFHLAVVEQGYASQDGALLQADGIFVRTRDDGSPR